ncbi:MAG TPA: hypothetical protein VM802_07380 [Chitinophaga sp.]|uniref:hypothetical protein n=1 Tax=Chitinophaga sp. TaxID=1869181 RepID=UPI002BF08B1E|nr:hypothetical protein [Chitinophaga sp.]HVI44673.1 hypothetical protein [Chitinophaga sp.]
MKFELLRGQKGPGPFIALLKALADTPVPDVLFILSSSSGVIAGWCFVPGKDAVYREHPAHRRRYSF